jgi:hypothetical protein
MSLLKKQNVSTSVPFLKIINISLAAVAHTCNPTYFGGRDQEDHGSKQVLGK